MRIALLSAVAKLLRLQIHFEGRPIGGRARLMVPEDVS